MTISRFSSFVHDVYASGRLVVQPRMGMAEIPRMQAGLAAVKAAGVAAIGTITLDSYTRVGDHSSARAALVTGASLNGFPIVSHGAAATRAMLDTVQASTFPVQVRHGSALPLDIIDALIAAGVDATEGGPVSYCLPYGRTPLREAIAAWRTTCERIAEAEAAGHSVHLESFGGCMLGQLCPPSLLIAISVLEGVFFARHGVRSLSLSYAQQVTFAQDLAALAVLRELADLHLGDRDWHIVLYTYMGVFPRTVGGALDILGESARLAAGGGAARLIVKTPAEAHRIPTVAENVRALQHATAVHTKSPRDLPADPALAAEIRTEAFALVDAVLNLHPDIDVALEWAFSRGLLDVPYCLHADNANAARAEIDASGHLRWQAVGRMPIAPTTTAPRPRIDPFELTNMLKFVERRFDAPHLAAANSSANMLAPGRPPAAGTHVIAIVGMGPRGLSVLEGLVRRLMADPDRTPVHIVAIDPYEIGAGRIWRTDQPDWFLMNTITGQVTMYSGPSDEGPWRPGAGPDLHEWLSIQDDAAMRAYGPNECVPRVFYGRYLVDVMRRIEAALPDHVTVERLTASVIDMSWRNGRACLTLQDGRVREDVHRVVLTTGHARNQPNDGEAAFLAFADRHPGLAYVMGDSAFDQPLERVAPGARVGIIGMGLGFYDVTMALTVGRGGRFEGTGDRLVYVPSGREPKIYAGSRSGLPIPSRGRNQKLPGSSYTARFFNTSAVRAARAAAAGGQLDFRRELMPLIRSEIALVFYRTLVRNRRGAAAEAAFAEAYIGAGGSAGAADVLVEFGVADQDAPDLFRLGRPFRGATFADPTAFNAELIALMRADLVEAHRGNVDSPLKAAMDVVRDVRETLRIAVDFGGLTPSSYRKDFLGEFCPVGSLLGAGPPPLRAAQAIALMEADVLRVVGPEIKLACDHEARTFTAMSPAVAGSRVLLDVIVDSLIPANRVRADADTLMRRLSEAGTLKAYVVASEDERFEPGGSAVTDSPFNAVDAAGIVNPHLYILGLPTEGTRWFTQVGSGTPNTRSGFTRDADAVAGCVLAGRHVAEALTANSA